MHKILQYKDFKISLIFSLIGLIASIYVALYQISMFSEEITQQIVTQLGSIEVLIPIAAIQGILITFVSTYIGLKLASRVNLRLNFKYDKKAMILSVLIGLSTALIITVSDSFIFIRYLPPNLTTYVFSPIYFIAGLLYGGIVEEILLRLLVMSLLVLVIWKIFANQKDSLNIPNWIYITAIILASTLFAAGHIPFTVQSIGLSTPILIRCFFLNGIGGIGFGYLYWTKGLGYAISAHAATHIFMQLVFLPILF